MIEHWESWEHEVQKRLGLSATICSGNKWNDVGDAKDNSNPRDNDFPLVVDCKYCVDAETEILTRRGWLRHDEVIRGDFTLGLNENGQVSWVQVDGVHVFPGHHEMVEWKWRRHDSLTTPDHRWLVERKNSKTSYCWVTTDKIQKNDSLVCGGGLISYPEQKHSDALVELVAWYWTEGCFCGPRSIGIAQSRRANPDNWNSINAALISCFEKSHPSGRQEEFGIYGDLAEQIWTHAPGKEKLLSLDFILSLTKAQLKLFIETSVKADGHNYKGRGRSGASIRIWQKNKESLDVLQIASQLLGKQSSLIKQSNGWCLHFFKRCRVVPNTSRRPRPKRVKFDGVVWCPTTSTGTWLARRNGQVYFTGNTSKLTFGLHSKILENWIKKAEELGKRGILAIRFGPSQAGGSVYWRNYDYVVMSMDDFQELREKAGYGV